MTEHASHGGETALGVLFALTFLVGGFGWFMYVRERKGKAGYTLARGEEEENFLGGDDARPIA